MTIDGKPIAVVGAGPVGSILAASFAAIGQQVLLVESCRERRDQIREQGLVVAGKCTYSTRPALLLDSVEELRNHEVQALFICTKTWALKNLLPELATCLCPEALVISFQNGIGVENEVGRYFSEERVARGIVNYAGKIEENGAVTMAWFNSPNYLGPLREDAASRLEALARLLSTSPLTTRGLPCHETKKRVFFKTILNSALNALCASTGITMRQAMSYRHTRNLANMLIREGLSVASAMGYSYGENAREQCMKYLDEGGDHLPSMWLDLKLGRPTEIEYINGKIAKIGLMFKNADVDANVFFTSMIITQEIKAGVRKPTEVPEYLTYF
jgi:2-dehydropantoate 2-reductase